jgi:serine phosphatase RsbU (regulator of sigma subunit)
MARSRFALLALAHRGAEPSDVLSELNSLLFEIRATDMLTVVYGVLDLSRRCWTEARAGHLPTLVRDLDGETRVLESKPGVPLAVLPDAQYGQEDYELGPGSAVVLYTDGLVERRGEVLDVGIDRLRERVRELDTDLDQACAAITGDLVGDAPADDSALLIAQLAADDALD